MMNASSQFVDDLCSRLHRLEGVGGDGGWMVEADDDDEPADSWDSALSNSPDDEAWWGLGGGVASSLSASASRHRQLLQPTDEGFLEDALAAVTFNGDGDVGDCLDNQEDAESVSSDGSEILQMVHELLLAFNVEVAAAAGSCSSSSSSSSSSDVAELATASGLASGLRLEPDDADSGADDEAVTGDHDFADLPLMDDEEYEEAGEWLHLVPGGSSELDAGAEADNEASFTIESDDHQQPPQPPSQFLATGLFRMPQEAVLEAMDFWGPLDRIRWLLWRPETCPPQPPQPQQQPQPRDKSRRACSFLLKGRCRKEDCEFAHDLARVTCKFWAAGQCFKGSACPFLHGYAP